MSACRPFLRVSSGICGIAFLHQFSSPRKAQTIPVEKIYMQLAVKWHEPRTNKHVSGHPNEEFCVLSVHLPLSGVEYCIFLSHLSSEFAWICASF